MIPSLRPYQVQAIKDLWKWFDNNAGNPCIVMPTASGKSHIIAEICKETIQSWPDTKILLLTHVKELIQQDVDKLLYHWSTAPVGVYSAGLGRKDLNKITFAGVQSICNKAELLGHIDLIIVDEAHRINHNQTGRYRQLINNLKTTNPKLKVIGLTATPYRLGHGLITDKPAIFDDIIEPVSIEQLQKDGFLSLLRSKVTKQKLSTEGVKKRGGEYVTKELQIAVDKKDDNIRVVKEIIELAGNRKHWLFFCTGIAHAEHIRDILINFGITAATVTGKTPKKERDQILEDYTNGKIQAVTNANVLTTGFDYPDIDLIAMLRPTMSPGLYIQMAGRGLRLKSHTDHCLVLDFAGVVEMHGPITDVAPPSKKGKGEGIAPSKLCPECDEIVHTSKRVCPSCGYIFPPPKKKKLKLHDDDIQGKNCKKMMVTEWLWQVHKSQKTGKEMLQVTYYGVLSDRPISEYLCIWHDGYAGIKAMQILKEIIAKTEIGNGFQTIERFLKALNDCKNIPEYLLYKKDGKWVRILERKWRIDVK